MDALIRVQIEALIAEFAWLIDRGDSSKVADLFTEDGRYGRSTGQASVGRDAIRAAYGARLARGPRTSRHVYTNLRLESVAPKRVRGSCILTLFAEDGVPPLPADPLLVADYDDEYVLCDDGQWRFQSRIVSWIFTSEATKRGGGLPLGTKTTK